MSLTIDCGKKFVPMPFYNKIPVGTSIALSHITLGWFVYICSDAEEKEFLETYANLEVVLPETLDLSTQSRLMSQSLNISLKILRSKLIISFIDVQCELEYKLRYL